MGHEQILKIATSIAEGIPVDWERLESEASDDAERTLLREMKKLARVLDSSSDLQDDPLFPQMEADAAAPIPEEPSPESGKPRLWAHLEVHEKIGSGAFGEVYRAWESTLERDVALKLLRPEKLDDPGLGRRPAGEILREGQLLARVRHPNVVTVFGAECHEGRIGLWMEFVRGHTLEEILGERGAFGAREAENIGLEICRALSAVHHAGIVHRDVKARNVVREEGGRVVLMDFGTGEDESARADPDYSRIAGTGAYMAPEVMRGERATKSSDIYSLGVLLYHMVTRSYPIEPSNLESMAESHEKGQVRLLRDARPDLPASFVDVVEKALAPRPEDRFRTAGEMEKALTSAMSQAERGGANPRIRGDWRRLLTLAVVLGLILTVILWKRSEFEWPIVAQPGDGGEVATEEATIEPVYRVGVSLNRTDVSGNVRPLQSGAAVQFGDGVFLEFEASIDMYLYVINEGEAGDAFLLFPLEGFETVNPLEAQRRHAIPGKRDGRFFSWEVTGDSAREHLLIVASPERLQDFEAEIARLPQPRSDAERKYTELSPNAKQRLRGLGGLLERPQPDTASGRIPRLFELAAKLSSRDEEVQGVWVRHVEFERRKP